MLILQNNLHTKINLRPQKHFKYCARCVYLHSESPEASAAQLTQFMDVVHMFQALCSTNNFSPPAYKLVICIYRFDYSIGT